MKSDTSNVEKVKPDLDIDEHIKAQERGWLFQSIGMYCVLAFVLSAAFGLFGSGIASKRRVAKDDVSVEYERFFRFEASMQVNVKATGSGDLTISFPASYLNNFDVSSIVPQPAQSIFSESRVQYVFKGKDEFDVTFYVEPQHVGTVESSIIINGTVLELKHFIFP